MCVSDSTGFHQAFFASVMAHEQVKDDMDGRNWIATQELTNRAGEIVANVGETCERVDVRSLPVLRDLGWIVPAADAPAEDTTPKPKRRSVKE